MSLLRHIQTELIDLSIPLEATLLKCRILAARLGSHDLAQWIDLELNGYPDASDLPAYRKLRVQCIGTMWGPGGAQSKNLPIPSLGYDFAQEIIDLMNHQTLTPGVAAIEDIARAADGPTIEFMVPNDILVAISNAVCPEGHQLVSISRVASTSAVKLLLSTIRSRLLSFVLEIEQQAPGAGEAESQDLDLAPESVAHTLNMTVFGGNVALGSSGFTQTSISVVSPGDFESLKCALLEAGLTESDVEALRTAIEGDKDPPSQPDRFGRNVKKWCARMMEKAIAGAWQVSLAAAGSVLGAALNQYFGLV